MRLSTPSIRPVPRESGLRLRLRLDELPHGPLGVVREGLARSVKWTAWRSCDRMKQLIRASRRVTALQAFTAAGRELEGVPGFRIDGTLISLVNRTALLSMILGGSLADLMVSVGILTFTSASSTWRSPVSLARTRATLASESVAQPATVSVSGSTEPL